MVHSTVVFCIIHILISSQASAGSEVICLTPKPESQLHSSALSFNLLITNNVTQDPKMHIAIAPITYTRQRPEPSLQDQDTHSLRLPPALHNGRPSTVLVDRF